MKAMIKKYAVAFGKIYAAVCVAQFVAGFMGTLYSMGVFA